MKCFEKRLTFLLVITCVLLLFLPKINLITMAGQTAGLRIDDVCLLFAAGIMFLGYARAKRSWLSIEKFFFLFFSLSVFSVCINTLLFDGGLFEFRPNILYVMRFLEYFVFFYIGYLALSLFSLLSAIKMLFTLNALVVIAQWFGWVGGFALGSYTTSIADRPIGMTSGPWEVAFVFNIIYCVFAFSSKLDSFFPLARFIVRWNRSSFKINFNHGILFLAFFALIAITGSRIAAIALVIAFIIRMTKGYNLLSFLKKRPISVLIGGLAICGSLIVALNYFPSVALVERSLNIFRNENLMLIFSTWDLVDVHKQSFVDVYGSVQMGANLPYDLSFLIRIHKWIYVAKYWLTCPFAYLFGIGPGACGTALDGGVLRLFVENGLIGAGLFCMLFRSIAKIGAAMKCIVVIFFINMCFVDIYLAYKGMSLLFFIAGYYCAEKREPANSYLLRIVA